MEKILKEITEIADYFSKLSEKCALESDIANYSEAKTFYTGKSKAYKFCSFFLEDFIARYKFSET